MYVFVPLLLLTVLCGVLAYVSKKERLIIFWLLWSGIIHILLETSYSVFHEVVKVQRETTFMEYMLSPVDSIGVWFDLKWWASIYEQYARYDARYMLHDPSVVFFGYIEIPMGIGCFLLIYLIYKNSSYRHPVQLILCAAQCFGTIMYFTEPLVSGTWSTVMTANTFELIVYVFMLNGLWITIPILMMRQSTLAVARMETRQRSQI